jgi:hypothetical protein
VVLVPVSGGGAPSDAYADSMAQTSVIKQVVGAPAVRYRRSAIRFFCNCRLVASVCYSQPSFFGVYFFAFPRAFVGAALALPMRLRRPGLRIVRTGRNG